MATGVLIEPLASLSETVGRELQAYVAVHDAMLTPSLSRVLPLPGIFRRIPFIQHSATLRQLLTRLREIAAETERFEATNPPPELTQPFLPVFRAYVFALHTAVARLLALSDRLAEKAERIRPYRWREYRRDVKNYDLAVAEYVDLGNRLNAILSQSTLKPGIVYPSLRFFSNVARSWTKSSKLRKLQIKIAPPGQTGDDVAAGFMQSLNGQSDKKASALAQFLDLCESDQGVKNVMELEDLSRSDLEHIYLRLRAVGLGQWVKGHYAALSTIAYGEPLLYVVRSQKRNVEPLTVASNLLDYWENKIPQGALLAQVP